MSGDLSGIPPIRPAPCHASSPSSYVKTCPYMPSNQTKTLAHRGTHVIEVFEVQQKKIRNNKKHKRGGGGKIQKTTRYEKQKKKKQMLPKLVFQFF